MSGSEDELAALRDKRAQELASRQSQEKQVMDALQGALEPAAFSRLMNIRLASPRSFSAVASAVIQMAQRGQLTAKVTDEQIKTLAGRFNAAKPEPKITIQRK